MGAVLKWTPRGAGAVADALGLGTGKTVSMTEVIEMAIDALEAKLNGEKR